jgi:hypothetical protein
MTRKCINCESRKEMTRFEDETFTIEHAGSRIKGVAQEELESENLVHLVARLSGRSYEQMRVIILEFLDTDIFHVSVEDCISFLDPLIESWDIDLTTFGMHIVLNKEVSSGRR